MPRVIPSELRNQRGLQKLKVLYAAQLEEVNGDGNAPALRQLRTDIRCIERELRGKTLVVSVAAATARK